MKFIIHRVDDVTESQHLTERQLAERRYRRHLDTAQDSILILSAATEVLIDANPFTTQLLGYAVDELVGKNFAELCVLLDAVMPPLRDVEHLCQDVKLTTKRDEAVTVEFTSHAYYSEDQRLIQCNLRDITARKRAEDAIRRQAGLLELAHDSIIVRGLDSRVQFWNRGATALYGWEQGEALGQLADTLLKTELPVPRSEIDAALVRTGFWEGEVVQFTKSGKRRVVAARWALQRDASRNAEAILEIGNDITERRQAETALRKTNQALLEAQRMASMGSWEWSPSTNSQSWSEEMFRIFGLDPSGPALDFQAVEKAYTSESWSRLSAAVRETLATGEPYVVEGEILRPDGTRRWVACRGGTVRDSEGNISGMRGTVQDITARKQTEDALRRTAHTLVEAQRLANIGNWECNSATGHSVWSAEVYRIFGRDPSVVEASHAQAETLYSPEDWRRMDASMSATLATGQPFEFECEVIRADGVRRWIVTRGEAVADATGKYASVRGTVQDITERRKIEEEFRALNATLEQRVLERTAQLDQSNHELSAFSYSVSHDLRAPLRGIDGWSLALMEDYASTLDARARKYLDRVRSETQRMGHLIDDLLRLSRITQTQMRLGHVDLSEIARSIIAPLCEASPERRIEFVIAPNVVVRGDAGLLRAAMANLLENAWKFTQKKASARVEFGTMKKDGVDVYFIRDDGAGFDMAYASKLFSPFQRMHKQSEFPGTGIGLATVQRVIHRHDGRIWAESHLDQGTSFFFTIGTSV